MNRITLYGRLTRQPETLIGANGKPVCRFSISVRRQYRREGEEYRYDFFECSSFPVRFRTTTMNVTDRWFTASRSSSRT